MIISIDYDDTYTKDPLLWNWFISEALERGHTVYCVTARLPQSVTEVEETIGRLIGHGNVIATSNQSKKAYVAEHYDFYVDVWIDDMPEAVVDWDPPLLKGLTPQ